MHEEKPIYIKVLNTFNIFNSFAVYNDTHRIGNKRIKMELVYISI